MSIKVTLMEKNQNEVATKLAVGEERLDAIQESYKTLRNSLWGVAVVLFGSIVSYFVGKVH